MSELSQVDACQNKGETLKYFKQAVLGTLPCPKIQSPSCDRDRNGCPDQ